jgi:hypothetical protein
MQIQLIIIVSLFAMSACKKDTVAETPCEPAKKDTIVANFEMKGISYVAMNYPIDINNITPLNTINCNWIAQMPFAHGYSSSPNLDFTQSSLWWGETLEGVKTTAALAKQKGIKTMLKPQIWISGSYTGAFTLSSEADWQTWENNYRQYIMEYAHLADSVGIELFCVGTELKLAVEKRPDFWSSLIDSIKTFYKGKLIYAANWDDYQFVPFWSKLDYIGIDGYFPLSAAAAPEVKDLVTIWQDTIMGINKYRITQNKDVIFTEIGYKSVDACAHEPWNPTSSNLNLQAQANATQAFFEAFANKPWFKGAFFWKWYPRHQTSGGANNKDYTPQNKPAEILVKKCF